MNCWWIIICMILYCIFFLLVLLMEETVWSCLRILTFECAHTSWVCVRNVFVCEFVGDWITEKWFAWTESETGYDFLFRFSHGVSAKCTPMQMKGEKESIGEKKTVRRGKKEWFEIESDFADMIYALWIFFGWRERERFSTTRELVKVNADFQWIVFDCFSLSHTWDLHWGYCTQHAYAHLAHSNPVKMEWNREWKF